METSGEDTNTRRRTLRGEQALNKIQQLNFYNQSDIVGSYIDEVILVL